MVDLRTRAFELRSRLNRADQAFPSWRVRQKERISSGRGKERDKGKREKGRGEERRRWRKTHDIEDVLVVVLVIEGSDRSEGELSSDVVA